VAGKALSALARAAAKRGELIPRPIALRILIDVLHGLHAAHELHDESGRPLNLVHRDVSPQNVLVGRDGATRLIDFGIAKFERREIQTRTGLIKGKASYMAPEQARGRELDRRCDVWAAGVMAWELLAGRRLFKTDDEMTTLFEVVTGEVPRLGQVVEVPAALEAAVASALCREVEQRCPTAKDFAERLSDAADAPLAATEEVARYVMDMAGDAIRAEQERIASALHSRQLTRVDQRNVDDPTAEPARDAHTATTHELVAPEPVPPTGRRKMLLAAMLIMGVVAAALATWRGMSPASSEEPMPASSVNEPPRDKRVITVTADAPLTQLSVNGKHVELPLPAERVEVEVDASATAVAIEAKSEDGRSLRHVSTSARNDVSLRFADPAPVGSASSTAKPERVGSPPPSPRRRPPRPKPTKPDDPPIGPSPYGSP
jgi:serine/threonine-protein kinase